MSRTLWLATMTALAAGVALVQAGCTQVDCGDGTIDRGGNCQPADRMVGSATCGAGTHLGTSGTCEPDYPADDVRRGTTGQVIDPDTGVITCKGTGGGDSCDRTITCPTPSTGQGDRSAAGSTTSRTTARSGTWRRHVALRSDQPDGDRSVLAPGQVLRRDRVRPAARTPRRWPSTRSSSTTAAGSTPRTCRSPGQHFIGVGVDDSDSGTADTYVQTGVAVAVRRRQGVCPASRPSRTDERRRTRAGELGRAVRHHVRRHGRRTWRYSVPRQAGPGRDGQRRDHHRRPRPWTTTTSRHDPQQHARTSSPSHAEHDRARRRRPSWSTAAWCHHSGTGGSLPGTAAWPSDLGAAVPGVVFVQITDAIEDTAPRNSCP